MSPRDAALLAPLSERFVLVSNGLRSGAVRVFDRTPCDGDSSHPIVAAPAGARP
jgi:hypothetical protein